jgi:hypothetical protein
MSFMHIKLEKTQERNGFISYKILCPDFSGDFTVENLGTISINIQTKTYAHIPSDVWIKNKIYPIKLFDTYPDHDREILKREYPDYFSAAWSIHLNQRIKKIITENTFPDSAEIVS